MQSFTLLAKVFATLLYEASICLTGAFIRINSATCGKSPYNFDEILYHGHICPSLHSGVVWHWCKYALVTSLYFFQTRTENLDVVEA